MIEAEDEPDVHILAVDDDPRNLLSLGVALGDLATHLTTVRSGQEALRLLLQRDFAVILLDVRMPAMDGFETAQLIRERARTRYVPIIFLTAYGPEEADMRRGYALGASDYLFKPIMPDVLRAKVGVFVELRRRTAEVARQAERLREMERREAERRLLTERRAWEAETLRLQMEEQRRVNRQLAEADRRKDDFIAVLAHELRNPLAPLAAGLEVLRRRPDDLVMSQEARAAMDRQVRHLSRLVDDLLDVSRISHGKVRLRPERVELVSIVTAAAESCRDGYEARELVIDPDNPPLTLQVDPVRLTQVIANLLGNAARYTEPGGTVVVRWRRVGDQVELTVQDDGKGMSPEVLRSIFEPFVQGPGSERGLGLGLTLVRQLVELHGGIVSAHSDGEGRGSVLTVRLPLLAQPGPVRVRRAAASPSRPPTPLPRLHVAVVDDSADIRTLSGFLLEALGQEVMSAADGEAGVQLILEQRPEVALVDIGMPVLDGFAVARRIRDSALEPRPYLVAMSGFGQAQDVRQALEAGFDEHLVKPASAESFERVLRTAAAHLTAPGR